MFLSLLCIIHTAPPWLPMTLVEKSFVSRFDTKKSHEIFHVPDCHLTPLIWWNWSKIKYYKTSKYPNSIKSFFSSYFSVYSRQRHFQSQWQWKSLKAKANTMVFDNKLFFNGFHSFENIFLLRNNHLFWNFKENVNVLKNSLLKMSNSIFIDWKLTKY